MTGETTNGTDDGTDVPSDDETEGAADGGPGATTDEVDLPGDVADESERLTRLARRAVDESEAAAYRERRNDLLADHGFTARLRDGDDGETLVCHPAEWEVDGDVHPDRIEDVDRAVERPLDGTGDTDDWDAVDEHNRAVAARVTEEHGERHGANAREFATFMSNHYARPVEQATDEMCEEFRTEYYRRNAWPSDAEREVVEESIALVRTVADEERRGTTGR